MLDEVGLFDESFFAYYEDVDLAWRARLMGWRCLYVPTARVFHVHSATGGQGPSFKQYLLTRNKLWTILKNYPAPGLWFNLPLVLFYDLAADLHRLIRERDTSSIRGRLAALARLPAVLHQRRVIQRQRRLPWRLLRQWMISPLNPLRFLRRRWKTLARTTFTTR
jgi:N-acetylglucosaminyl-diphospho-decaprenol L-rhamnosyltransferase